MRTSLCLIAAAIAFTAAAHAQNVERQLESIRKTYTEVNARIEEMQRAPEFSSVFAIELSVNKYSAPYPAVGIYQRNATFYYTYGNRERSPYPDKLLKIAAVYKRSNRTETADFYFDGRARLIFVLVANQEGAVKESRIYFSAGRIVRLIDDAKEIGMKSRRAVEAGLLANKEAARLSGIFRAALTHYD